MNPHLMMIKCHFVLRNVGCRRGKAELWKWSTRRAALPLCLPHLFYSLECQEQELKHRYYLFCSDPRAAAWKPALYYLKTVVRVFLAAHGKAASFSSTSPRPPLAPQTLWCQCWKQSTVFLSLAKINLNFFF